MRATATDPDRPTFPDLADQIGEDPARWLAESTSFDPRPRITGIDDRATAAAWLAVARRLDCDREVRELLVARRDALADDKPEAVEQAGGQPVATDGGASR